MPFQASSSPSTHSSQPRGTCLLTGIAICENERVFKKEYCKLYDAQLFVPGDATYGDGVLAVLRYYDEARSTPDASATRAFFVTASIGRFAKNHQGHDIASQGTDSETYDLAGDIQAAFPVKWSVDSDVVNPEQPAYATVSGMVNHVDESAQEITVHLPIENYLGVLDGRGSLDLAIVLNLRSPRWAPSDNKRRAPYLRPGQYITATGPLIGVLRDPHGKVTGLKLAADNIVNAGPRAMPGSQGNNGSFSETHRKAADDPITPLKKFSFSRPKRTRPVDPADDNSSKKLKTTSTAESELEDAEASVPETPTPVIRNNRATRNAKTAGA
ncbi:hypothetical protein DFP72DRAFT_943621 [Ephemerocybe angulata]|uniref:Uncharacterized protein n=1 Tax=Ephemerocybe angulata TaxID=980116 RepID=A0A8H6LTB7_9AGAR|nr:hypothetical protein DFP72DRAFT_943621 [Tulosesus angulatus]